MIIIMIITSCKNTLKKKMRKIWHGCIYPLSIKWCSSRLLKLKKCPVWNSIQIFSDFQILNVILFYKKKSQNIQTYKNVSSFYHPNNFKYPTASTPVTHEWCIPGRRTVYRMNRQTSTVSPLHPQMDWASGAGCPSSGSGGRLLRSRMSCWLLKETRS